MHEPMWCRSDDNTATKIGVKIPIAYWNNDEILLEVTFYLDTLYRCSMYTVNLQAGRIHVLSITMAMSVA